ncbi:MAG: hypothetical protein HY600_06850 [Candidatus Omnitrophica bacterium]|nr:hypothetical protein [Candidatus Omnitrophota bacterium]
MIQIREQFMVDTRGHPTAVVLGIREYRKLLRQVEDAEDIKYIKAHRREKTVPFAKVVAELKTKGLLV